MPGIRPHESTSPDPSMSEVELVPRRRRGGGCVLILLFLFLLGIGALITLRSLGLIEPLLVQLPDMTPAVSTGDHVLMEQFTFKSRPPQRGDVVVFRMTKPGQSLEPGTYVLRIAALPGETLHLTENGITVNDKPLTLQNVAGKIHYSTLPEAGFLSPEHDSVTVPKGQYFMLGDNSNGSKDSRFWGLLPAENITGKVSLCFWPSTRMGLVK